jgi:5'-methylthioadenosine phosphorylase
VSFGDPVCSTLSALVLGASRAVGGGQTHQGGVYVCIEGPAFSSRAESEMYRSFGADVVGMTNLPEAKLAREAEISYATVGMATDYDCWRTEGEQVSVEGVLRTLRDNADRAKELVSALARSLATHEAPPPCGRALDEALMTPRDAISSVARARLGVLLERVLS